MTSNSVLVRREAVVWRRSEGQRVTGGRQRDQDLRARDYTPRDHDACMEVFQTNVPKFFKPHERDEFRDFLNALPGPYLVFDDRAYRVLACGGYAFRENGTVADLCWGMVRQELHGLGLGRVLTHKRIQRILRDVRVTEITLHTSQHTTGFYERLGFTTVDVQADGYAPGLDRCEMRRVLAGEENLPGP